MVGGDPSQCQALTQILTIRGPWRGAQRQDHGCTVTRALGLCMGGDYDLGGREEPEAGV